MQKTSESRINNTNFEQSQEVTANNSAITLGTGANRRTNETGDVDAFFVVQSLLDRHPEIFYHVLSMSDWDTLLNLRRVSKATHELSMVSMSRFCPLKCNDVFISFKISELTDSRSEKLQFALKYTGIDIYIHFSHLANPKQLCDHINLKKGKVGLTFTISDNIDLSQLNALFLTKTLSDELKLIIDSIKGLSFTFLRVSDQNINDINTLLNFFATEERAFQLRSLCFGRIESALTLPELAGLKLLAFMSIDAELTLPVFPSLIKLRFGLISTPLTLPELPKLMLLGVMSIEAALTLSKLESLTSLEFGEVKNQNVNEVNTLLSFFATQLKSLCFGSIESALTLPELPSLKRIRWNECSDEKTRNDLQKLFT
ncbi:MAG: hypothetical protein C5B43_01715 [Verrucomicrobia bacterium]|nr:MAG: hypothetical protein C5B43_01715 [Verrucomicrobiota bacterium]